MLTLLVLSDLGRHTAVCHACRDLGGNELTGGASVLALPALHAASTYALPTPSAPAMHGLSSALMVTLQGLLTSLAGIPSCCLQALYPRAGEPRARFRTLTTWQCAART